MLETSSFSDFIPLKSHREIKQHYMTFSDDFLSRADSHKHTDTQIRKDANPSQTFHLIKIIK